MSQYIPDVWVIVRFTTTEETINKILAGWYGGFGDSNSWKLSSGIEQIEEHDNRYEFHNCSGSVYICNKETERTSALTASIFAGWEKEMKKQPEIKAEIISIKELRKQNDQTSH